MSTPRSLDCDALRLVECDAKKINFSEVLSYPCLLLVLDDLITAAVDVLFT